MVGTFEFFSVQQLQKECYKDTNLCITTFSQNRPTGPIRSISRDVRPSICLYLSCPLPMQFFCVRGLVRSVTRPWTGAERHSSMDWCRASLVNGLVRSVRRPRVEP